MKKTVLFFLQAGVGGAERMTVLFGKMLNELHFKVKFYIVPKGNVSSTIKSFIPSKYEVSQIDESSPLRLLWNLNKIIKNEKPDIVFSSLFYLNNKLLMLKLLYPSVKFIVRCENYLYTFSKKQQILMRLVYKKADKIIAQTEEMRDELVQQMKIDSEKINVMHNPIDEEYIKKCVENSLNPFPNNGKKHFLAAGRFAYQKGFDLLIEAFDIVCRKRNDIDLYIIGVNDGNSKKEYERVWSIVKDRHLDSLVHSIGFQNNPYCFVENADVFVLSSRWEGMPNVLLEAMYLGTPVASFKCIPIIERIVEDGVMGCLAEADNPKSLADAMVASLEIKRGISFYRGTVKDDVNAMFGSFEVST